MPPADVIANSSVLSPSILIVPGLGNSGPGHWQSLFEAAYPHSVRVVQDDWLTVERQAWTGALDAAIAAAPTPPVLVAHSGGCLAVVAWGSEPANRGRAAAALLVAPPDIETGGPDIPGRASWLPLPQSPLPFPSFLVASRNDPYCSFERAAAFAQAWGSRLIDLGEAGHINLVSGFGPWPKGQELLEQLIAGE